MARLVIAKSEAIEIPGLARNRPFDELSQKRVTRAAREALRAKYGHHNVEVSCSAFLRNGIWIGQCSINGTKVPYQLMR